MLWVVVPSTVLLVLSIALIGGALFYTLAGSRHAQFEVSPAGLRLRGDLYGRLIPATALHTEAARVVDLRTDPALQPVERTEGTAIPGYRAGWFRLQNGERALLYVTDPSRVAYVPTRAGYSVLLSVADPAVLVASLRRVIPGSSHAP